jgi:hypothetical protein
MRGLYFWVLEWQEQKLFSRQKTKASNEKSNSLFEEKSWNRQFSLIQEQ